MTRITDDLASINLQYLMLVREFVRVNPGEAVWRFNLDMDQVSRIKEMCMDDIRELAHSGRAVFVLNPPISKPGIDQRLLSILTDKNANR